MHAKKMSLDVDPPSTHLRRGILVCRSLIYQVRFLECSDIIPMGCCNSTANDSPPAPAPAKSVPVLPATPREPVAEGSSTTLSQRRGRTSPPHLPTHGRQTTPSPEVLRRVMSESSPQPSSPSPKIKRNNSVQASPSASRRQVLTPTVRQVLSNHSKPLKYVA